MTPWCDRRMTALDLETTSADPEEARVVAAAVAFVGGGKDTLALDWLADPGVEIPEEAAAIHGITTERARAEGQPAVEVIRDVLEAVASREPGTAVVVMNARYDLTVLDREARRHGLEPLSGLLVVDPLVLDRHLDRFRPGSRKLDALCAHYNAVLGGAHDAGYDAIAAARVAWRIGQQGDVVRRARGPREAAELAQLRRRWDEVRHDLPALHDYQAELAAAEAVRLQEYFRRGNPEKGVPPRPDAYCEPAWPVIPFSAEREVAA